jgi:hypothetical protein
VKRGVFGLLFLWDLVYSKQSTVNLLRNPRWEILRNHFFLAMIILIFRPSFFLAHQKVKCKVSIRRCPRRKKREKRFF